MNIILPFLISMSSPQKHSTIITSVKDHAAFPMNVVQKDSSNYEMKIVKNDVPYTQLRFKIVSHDNTPIDAYIIIEDDKGNLSSGILTGKDGEVLYLLWDTKAQFITVVQMGFGKVKIPTDEVRKKIVDITVKLYPLPTIN